MTGRREGRSIASGRSRRLRLQVGPFSVQAPLPTRPTSLLGRGVVSLVVAGLLALGVFGGPASGQVDDPTTTTTVTEPTTVPDPDPGATSTTSSTTTTDDDDPAPTSTSTTEPVTTTTSDEGLSTTTTTTTIAVDPDTTSTTGPNPLLVAGPSDGRRDLNPDPDPGSTTDAAAVETVVPSDSAGDAERVIRRVVIGLVAVAVLLAALAVYYWWITRPPVLDELDLDEAGDTVEPWPTDSTSTR